MSDSHAESDRSQSGSPVGHVKTCHVCGAGLAAGRCLNCESQRRDRFVHREIVILAVLVGVTIAAFFLTRRLAASNDMLRLQDARAWYLQGQQALQRGDLEAALMALRRAAAKNPTDLAYRLALARALIAEHDDDAARQMLLVLRDEQPEDAETNLELARLEVHQGDRPAVGRYYQAAIGGLWRADQRALQRQVRIEFIEFLLDHGERDRALSELLVLEASLPDDRSSQLAAGRMLLAAGDARRAGDHFTRVLRLDPNDQVALAGAGETSFELGDFERARRYFDALIAATPRATELRTITDFVLNDDPLAPRLPINERRRRLSIGVGQIVQRLETCQARGLAERQDPGADLEPVLVEARGLDAVLHAVKTRSAFDDIEGGFDLVVRGERVANRACGMSDPLDHALLLIAGRHGLDDR